MPDHIFLSYAHEDKAHAEKFQRWLTCTFATGCYWADGDAGRGPGWRETIEKALEQCKAAVILVTSRSKDRNWVNFEAGLCLGKGIRIFPIILPECGDDNTKSQRMRTLENVQHFVWGKKTAKNLGGEIQKAISDQGVQLKVSYDLPVNFCLKSTDFVGPRTEKEFIEELYRSRPLANLPQLKDRFLSDEYDLSPVLIDAYIGEYCTALEDARKHREGAAIPLSTRHRMKVALRILRKASTSVRAISVIRNDLWLNSKAKNLDDDQYLAANCEVGKKLKKLKEPGRLQRLIVCHEAEFAKNIDPAAGRVIRRMQESNIELKWITENEVRPLLEGQGRPPLENLLVVDKRWMTQSTGEGHDGKYSISRKLIEDALDSFEKILWPAAHPVPHPYEYVSAEALSLVEKAGVIDQRT